MDARKEVVLMARIFGAIAIVVAAMVGLGELADRFGALAFSAALFVIGVALIGAASFSEAHRAD